MVQPIYLDLSVFNAQMFLANWLCICARKCKIRFVEHTRFEKVVPTLKVSENFIDFDISFYDHKNDFK